MKTVAPDKNFMNFNQGIGSKQKKNALYKVHIVAVAFKITGDHKKILIHP